MRADVVDPHLPSPDRRAFLAPDQVDAIVGPVRAELARLAEQVAAAEAEADAAEERAAGRRTDALATAASLQADAHAEMARALEMARVQAAAVVNKAQADADRIRNGAPTADSPTSDVTGVEALAHATTEGATTRDMPDGPAPPMSLEALLAPVVVEGPPGGTWRLRSETPPPPPPSPRAYGQLFFPMLAAVVVIVVILVAVG